MSKQTAATKKDTTKKDTTKKDTTNKDTTKSETTANASEGTASESATPAAASATSKGSASSQSISYFSSVSTDEYRSGWDNVFNAKTAKRGAPAKRRRSTGPAMIELRFSDLDEELRARLEDIVRAKAKAKRINYDNRETSCRLVCELNGRGA